MPAPALLPAGLGLGFAFTLMFHNTEIYQDEYRASGRMWRMVWDGMKTVARRGWSQGKIFASVGFVWAGTECMFEKVRVSLLFLEEHASRLSVFINDFYLTQIRSRAVPREDRRL